MGEATEYKIDSATIEDMKKVRDGADVYDQNIARRLRKLVNTYPELIALGPAGAFVSGEKRQPYFGAVLRKAGKEFIDALGASVVD